MRGALAEKPECLGAVDPGQLEVHQDQLRRAPLRQLDTLLAGPRLDHLVSGELQHVPDQLEVPLVVLDDEDPGGHGASDRCVAGPAAAGIARTCLSADRTSSRPTGFTR